MNPTTIVTLLVSAVALALPTAFAFYYRAKFSAAQTEVDVYAAKLRNRDEEIAHLRGMQARKVDRALFMLAAVRADRTIKAPPQLFRDPLNVELKLDASLVDAMCAASEAGESCVGEIIAQHVSRVLAQHRR